MVHETSPIDGQTGSPPLRRDDQQWVFDYLVQETGRVMHFQGDGRGPLPKSVRSHAMINKHVGRQALRVETVAETEEQAGHPETALASDVQLKRHWFDPPKQPT